MTWPCYLRDMKIERKATYTYASLPSVVQKAKKKAAKENLTLSEKIDQLLKEYVKPQPHLVNHK
jgi:hypothetical protein